ncbi:unnamed protein product [Rotaria sp. Silwood2]|nr:unnamed protein product [Rotaria sp. Silwood2]
MKVEKIVQSICEKEPIIHNPNLTPLKQIIDAEHRTYRTGSDANSAQYSTGEQICIVENSDRNEILRPLMLVVQSPPIKSSEQPKCSSCSKSFGFFRRRYWCRMCGNNQCGDCQTWQTCRHLGYTTPISICRQCASLRKSILINIIFEHIQQLLNKHISSEHLIVYIHLLKHYCASDTRNEQLYKQASEYFLSQKQFSNAIQCYNVMSSSHESWFRLAELLCTYSEYQYASLCFNVISEHCHYESHKWDQIGDDYLMKGNAILALLSYRKANTSIDEIWLKTLYEKKLNADYSALFIFYTTFQKQTSKQLKEWTKWLNGQIQVDGYMLAAISTLQLANFSTQEWAIVLNDLSNRHHFMTMTSILKILDKTLLNQLMTNDKCTNHFLQLALQSLVNEVLESVEKSITRINYQSDIEQILFELALVHVFHLPDWQKVQNIFLSTEQIEQVLFCTKVYVLIQAKSSINFDWIESGLEANQPIFYLLESQITNRSYMELADAHAKSKHTEIALNYYLLALYSSPQLSTVETILSSATRLLSSSEALRCYIAVYKQLRTNVTCAAKALESIVDFLQAHKKPIMPVLASAILALGESGNHVSNLYVCLLEELSKQFDENFSLIHAIHHVMTNISPSTQALSQKMQKLILGYRDFLQAKVYNEIKQVVYENIVKLAVCANDVTDIDALKRIKKEYFDNRKISTLPGEYRAKFYMIECMIAKLENRNIDAVEKLNEAIVVCATEDTVTAVLMILIYPSFHQAILKDLLNFIQTLVTTSETNSFASFVPPPLPIWFSTENLLTMNPNLRLVRTYERANFKTFEYRSITIDFFPY